VFGLGVSELIIIGVIVLLIFGARRLPEIGQGLGKTVKEIRNLSKEAKGEEKRRKPPRNGKSQDSEQTIPPKSVSLTDEIENLPGVEEIKTVKETASQVRKWWRFLKP
jgi:sec-independent protein translocase protein TatA